MTMREDALRLAALKALREAIDGEYEAIRQKLHDAMRDEDITAVKPQIDGERVATVTLGGGRTTARVSDEAALIDWAASEYPAEVETVTVTRLRSNFRARLLAEAQRQGAPVNAMGEALPGVAVSTSAPYVSARFADGGAEAVVAAWRAGAVPLGINAPVELPWTSE